MAKMMDMRVNGERAILAWSDVRSGDIIRSTSQENHYDGDYDTYDRFVVRDLGAYALYRIYDSNWTIKFITACRAMTNTTRLPTEYYKVLTVIKVVEEDKSSLGMSLMPCHELYLDHIGTTLSILSLLPDVLTQLILAHL